MSELVEIDAELAFIDAVLSAFEEAGAVRQRITHTKHRFTDEERAAVEPFRVKRIGLASRKQFLGILPKYQKDTMY